MQTGATMKQLKQLGDKGHLGDYEQMEAWPTPDQSMPENQQVQ